jgi:hypothetical protein
LCVRTRSNRAGRGRPEDLLAKASAEIDVAAVTVEGSPQKGRNRENSAAVPVQVAAHASHPSQSGPKFDKRPLRLASRGAVQVRHRRHRQPKVRAARTAGGGAGEGRIEVLNRLREELRERGYLPIVFNFDKPETKDFTETVRLLAGLSKFVIADLTSPKSAPYELGAIVSQTMIPFQPIITAGETPFAMLRDLLTSYPDRVFQPIEYPSVDRLIETMDAEIIGPAEARFDELVMRRAETLKVRRV